MKKTSRKELSLQTRTAFLDAAIALLSQKPIGKITVDEICKTAKSSVGTFYYYFSSKDDLFLATYLRHDQAVEAMWGSQNFSSPLDSIRFLIMQQLYGTSQYGAAYTAHYFALQLTVAEESEKIFAEGNQAKYFFPRTLLNEVSKLCQQVQPDVDPAAVTADILRSTRGVMYDWSAKSGSYDIFTVGQHHLEMVLSFYHLL